MKSYPLPRFPRSAIPAAILATILELGGSRALRAEVPRLEPKGTTQQLIVNGTPFLIRGGELGNSSASVVSNLDASWEKFASLNLNTVVAPVYWNLIQPTETQFDFASLDQLVARAREHRLHLVLLWFGSWKNSMSCYVPDWIKTDPARFPRTVSAAGVTQEILSPYAASNLAADRAAFSALMQHLRQTDEKAGTVVLVQVENEMGMLPEARDHSALGEKAFAGPVPKELLAVLSGGSPLTEALRSTWTRAGARTQGSWAEVFGSDSDGEEIFTAWSLASYANAVAAAGKARYPVPMYANAALIRPGYQPGQYPSGGPLPHLADVWRAAAPALDFISPDIYFADFSNWADRYTTPRNPLFIPEVLRGPETAVNGLYAYGQDSALGFSPFSIDSPSDATGRSIGAMFGLIDQLEPLILAHRGDGSMIGLLPKGAEQLQPDLHTLNGYQLSTTFERGAPTVVTDGMIVPAGAGSATGALVIATRPGEFIIAGSGVTVTFTPVAGGRAGILEAAEGRYVNGTWETTLFLNGDQTHQGRHIRLEPGRFSIQKVRLYTYR